jgi:hypothetical protein
VAIHRGKYTRIFEQRSSHATTRPRRTEDRDSQRPTDLVHASRLLYPLATEEHSLMEELDLSLDLGAWISRRVNDYAREVR